MRPAGGGGQMSLRHLSGWAKGHLSWMGKFPPGQTAPGKTGRGHFYPGLCLSITKSTLHEIIYIVNKKFSAKKNAARPY